MPENRILTKMLDRLYATLARGPSLNCRPHSSRQRIDLTSLRCFGQLDPRQVLIELLGPAHSSNVPATISMPDSLVRKNPFEHVAEPDPESLTDEERVAEKAWRAQKSLLGKLRNLSEDALTYEQDTGVHALNLGYPILSLPPGTMGGTRRILAPLAFIPLSLEVNAGRRPHARFRCHGEGVDLVTPNPGLMAWIERETGQTIDELFEDEEGAAPWREIGEIIQLVAKRLEMDSAALASMSDPEQFQLAETPRADDLPPGAAILPAAVIGLFPSANQGLLRDTKEMIAAPSFDGPVAAFLELAADLAAPDPMEIDREPEQVERRKRRCADERNVALADPFQSQAVERARTSRALVIHGPPGTGKSQTITNIIGDHLARGERVLFVCDKRTALDVVANRLDHLGLGRLCAVVHDPRRDQRDLYMGVRASLDDLGDLRTDERAAAELERVNKELQAIHDELYASREALMDHEQAGVSFHELMGRYVTLAAPSVEGLGPLEGVSPAKLDEVRRDIEVACERARGIGYPTNPWVTAIDSSLATFLSLPIDDLRRRMASLVEDARTADRRLDERIPPFHLTRPLDEQAKQRAALETHLRRTMESVDARVQSRVSALDDDAAAQFVRELAAIAPQRKLLAPLDRELSLSIEAALPPIRGLNEEIGALERYLVASGKWWGFIAFGARSAANRALRPYGLACAPEAAQRLLEFLKGLRARILLSATLRDLRGEAPAAVIPDEELVADFADFEQALGDRALADGDAELSARTRRALFEPAEATDFLEGLRRSVPRAEALGALEQSLAAFELLSDEWCHRLSNHVRTGNSAGDTLQALEASTDSIENVLRVMDTIADLPAPLSAATAAVVQADLDPEQALVAIERQVLAAELGVRVRGSSSLQRLDGERIEHALRRYAELDAIKHDLVRDVVLHEWVERQRACLMASTRSRLNSAGAALRRRLFVRGRRAMRLRQVIAAGESETAETGEIDPLFTMCPVWMASPETAAQIFPRRAIFDVIIFDEASQCRLEEALPSLTRAHRAVIAGDPKQLPPSRFFEAAIATSDEGAIDSEQDLFEMQQGEVEDLLAAALNLQVDEAYLDVHYRSRNPDLIEFSNAQFYQGRLQSIPGHPSNRAIAPPLRVDRADGVYDDRCNRVEAERVCQIVADLLKRADPPSIGIACFNLRQRDLIRDLLDEQSNEDPAFARRLAVARARRGEGSFEGLFVKNLENVQGDERDHIIISTTYGPNKQGKFHRRFGPLGNVGGGRRLNVLVTRAREEVHLVTSIPREAYASTHAIPEGASPNGAWLLFAYLRYAEELVDLYAQDATERAEAGARDGASVIERPIDPISRFSMGLGVRLAEERAIGSDVHWGNAGFCVDLALHHPEQVGGVTAGVLCDFARYDRAPDPIVWEVFRTAILESQGWQLHRVWTPAFFRDGDREIRGVEAAAAAVRAAEPS